MIEDFIPVEGVDGGVIGEEFGVVEFGEGVGADGEAVGEEGVFFGGFVAANDTVEVFLCVVQLLQYDNE